MGDLIHTLPALTDAGKAYPDIRFDWVVEEGLSEIPAWHPQVDKIIVIGLRRWLKHPWRAIKSGEVKRFYQSLTSTKYDFVIDAQALVKSAVVTRLAKGKRFGYDARSVRGKFANVAYDKTFFIDQKIHAITRIRTLFAKTLQYSYQDGLPDFALNYQKFLPAPFALPKDFVIFVHNASWTSKLWPENYWIELIKKVTHTGLHVVLPWGNNEEKQRAEYLAAAAENNRALILPKLKLSQLATVFTQAKAAVMVDTGLGHLAGALKIPAVSLYGATDKALIGTMGDNQIHLSANFPCSPCKLRTCNYKENSAETPACFTTVPPEKVWVELQKII